MHKGFPFCKHSVLSTMTVLERSDGTTFDVDRAQIPAAARPGDSLEVQADGKIILRPEETSKRKERVQKLMDGPWE